MAGETRTVSGTHRLLNFCLLCTREGQQLLRMAKDVFIHFFKLGKSTFKNFSRKAFPCIVIFHYLDALVYL